MLVCAPFIIIVTGIVSMTAARAFKKYWVRYTDMGAAFLDNLQGLETLKTSTPTSAPPSRWTRKPKLPRHDHARAADPAALADRHGHSGLRRCCGRHRCGVMAIRAYWRCFCQWCVRLVANRTGLTSAGVLAYAAYGLHYLIRSGWATRCLLPVCCSLCCCPPNSLFPCVSLARSSTWR